MEPGASLSYDAPNLTPWPTCKQYSYTAKNEQFGAPIPLYLEANFLLPLHNVNVLVLHPFLSKHEQLPIGSVIQMDRMWQVRFRTDDVQKLVKVFP